jgi:hypothetical protein
MEKESNKPTAGTEKRATPAPAKDGILVVLVKTFLGLNFLKWGIKKDF